MNLSCIIIEDEPLAIEKLEGFIKKVPFLNLAGTFENALDGLHFLKTNPVDVLFLDIQMEQLTGIQLLETSNIKPYVIITSAYAEYALKGYELRVFDYLLKPISFERFLSAVNKVSDDISSKNVNHKENSNLFVKTEYRIENIEISKILYIEGMQGYLRIVLPEKKIMAKQSFKTLMEQLPSEEFIQVHKSWVVALSKIETIERNKIIIRNIRIPIGDSYKEFVAKIIKNLK
jgi:DNA-binding LytR/AlgR family response regulator